MFIGIGTGVLVVVLLLVLLLRGEEQYDWEESYTYNNEQPFDNNLIYELLRAHVYRDSFFHIKTALAKEIKPSEIAGKASYIYIGRESYLTEEDADSLLVFVSNGNDAFISTNSLDFYLQNRLDLYMCGDDLEWDNFNKIQTDTTVKLNFTHPHLKRTSPVVYSYTPLNAPKPYGWSYFNLEGWCGGEKLVARLGTMDKRVNFIRVKYGEGYFYLHTTPIAFTNFYLRDSVKLEYAEKVFSHLPHKTIYWDEAARYWHEESYTEDNSRSPFGQSELKYILSQPASKWAFYTLLTGVLLYILFFMKRRQRIIPVVEPYANTSIEYVQTVGGLYFMKQEHHKLAEQQFRLFLSFVRNRYRLATQQLDEDLINRLVRNSKVDEARVRIIFNSYHTVSANRGMSEEQLINFNRYLEYFYQNCK